MANTDLDVVLTGSAIILQTQKRDGTWVSTAVTPTRVGDTIVVLTAADSGKAKRIRNFPTVKVAAGTNRQKMTGPVRLATATKLEGPDASAAVSAIRRAHPITFGLIIRLRYSLGKHEAAVVRLSDLRPE